MHDLRNLHAVSYKHIIKAATVVAVLIRNGAITTNPNKTDQK